MSTQAQAKTKRTFRQAPAAKLPTLVCTGYVASVEEGHESEKGLYNVNPIEINGYGSSRNTKVQLLTRPEWFEVDENGYPTFRPDQLAKAGEDKVLFVYRKNISSVDSIPLLEGLAGNEERYEQLQEALLSAEGITGENSFTVIQNVLEKFLTPEGGDPVEIGYILKQKRIKTDDLDENGKNIYLLDRNYEISEFFEATEANKKKYRKAAEKSLEKSEAAGEPVRFKVCFDDGAPF